jgi:hypothetical protein
LVQCGNLPLFLEKPELLKKSLSSLWQLILPIVFASFAHRTTKDLTLETPSSRDPPSQQPASFGAVDPRPRHRAVLQSTGRRVVAVRVGRLGSLCRYFSEIGSLVHHVIFSHHRQCGPKMSQRSPWLQPTTRIHHLQPLLSLTTTVHAPPAPTRSLDLTLLLESRLELVSSRLTWLFSTLLLVRPLRPNPNHAKHEKNECSQDNGHSQDYPGVKREPPLQQKKCPRRDDKDWQGQIRF